MKTKLFVALTILFLFATPALGLEDALKLPQVKILPGSTQFPLKRLTEKLRWILTFSKEGKYSYQKSLVDIRLSELKTLVEKDSKDLIESSGQRFAYQIGTMADFTNSKADLEKYVPTLEVLRDKFPANSTYWLVLQQDIDTIHILTQKID